MTVYYAYYGSVYRIMLFLVILVLKTVMLLIISTLTVFGFKNTKTCFLLFLRGY